MRALTILLLITLGVALSVLADVFLKKSGFVQWRYVVIGFMLYGFVAVPVAIAFKYVQFGSLFLIWEAVMVLMGLAVATFYYHESFTIYRFIALLLAFGALYFSYK